MSIDSHHPENHDHDRAPRSIDEAIEAELVYHVESLRADIEREGLDPEQAASEVRRRFGDPAKYRNDCWRIAVKEEIMKQRMQYIVMGVMLALIVGLGIYAVTMRQRAVEQLRAAEMQRERAEAASHFMMEMLSAQDAYREARQVSVQKVLDAAAERVYEWNLEDDPELEARLREVIDKARDAIETDDDERPDGSAGDDGTQRLQG